MIGFDLSKYIGVEFADKGRGEKCDCWGLVKRLYKELFKIELPSYDEYDSSLDIQSASNVLLQKMKGIEDKEIADWVSVKDGEELIGDIVLFRVMGAPVHVGMVVGKGRMIHIEKGINSCIESYRGTRWKNRIEAFYRHKLRQ